MFELAVGIVRQAVAARLVVRAGALDRGVVLGDVKIDRPGPQRRGQRCCRRVVELGRRLSSPSSAGRMRSSGAL